MPKTKPTVLAVILILGTYPAFAQEAKGNLPEVHGMSGKRSGSVPNLSGAERELHRQLVQEGLADFAQKRWAEAEQSLGDALAMGYAPLTAHYYARALQYQGKDAQALQAYRRLFATGSIHGSDENGLISYAELAAKVGLNAEAAGAYGRLLREQEGALAEFQSYLGKQPDLRRLRTVALVVAGRTAQGSKEAGLRYLREAAASDPAFALAQFALGKALLSPPTKTEERVEARERLQTAARLGTDTIREQAEKALKAVR